MNSIVYVTLKRKTIRYSVLFMFLIEHGNSKKITEKLTFRGKNILFLSKGRCISHKNIVKSLKNVE